jgi:hypothetical protein
MDRMIEESIRKISQISPAKDKQGEQKKDINKHYDLRTKSYLSSPS